MEINPNELGTEIYIYIYIWWSMDVGRAENLEVKVDPENVTLKS